MRNHRSILSLSTTLSLSVIALATGLALASCASAGSGSSADSGNSAEASGGSETDVAPETSQAPGQDRIVGAWGNVGDSTQPSLEFAADGSVTGTDGCNQLMGSWTETDGVITLADLASTRMACEGVDTWLSGAATAEIIDDVLVVSDASGAEIGTLVQPVH